MLRSSLAGASRLLLHQSSTTSIPSSALSTQSALFSTQSNNNAKDKRYKPGPGVPLSEMPYYHHQKKSSNTSPLPHDDPRRPPKFKSPRKRASKLFHQLNQEAITKSKSSNPNVLNVPFRVGDAIEIELISMGGVNSTSNIDKIRGVVLGKSNKGLGSSVQIRDVMYGEPIDRQVPLHSPLLKSLKVLEKNFVHKGKKKVKRAKLYYLRDRLPVETRVTKW